MNTLTVYFDDPWWVGLIACEEAGTLRVYRHVFGSEPSGEEVLAFVLRDFLQLTSRSVAGIVGSTAEPLRRNPKRAAREAARQTAARGITTKAQEALRVAHEAEAQTRQATRLAERKHAAEQRWAQARARARARHHGR
ncbi:MAG: YjdF family protein [Chloroflexales bacterium]|nr:YjdF family protein [Chloroflexales bacterium]